MANVYYPLHVHLRNGSVGDSILSPEDYAARGHELGLKALAVTDHGSMSAMYSLVNACEKYAIKPIIGMEAYVVDDNSLKDADHKKGAAGHLVLLAKNDTGLKNLLNIHNQAATDGFYYEARTDWDHLQKWGKGIIASSACVGGEIPRAILEGDMEQAKNLIGFYREIFDEFYLEIQPGHFEEQLKVNRTLVKLSKETDTPLIVTNDIHYLKAEDAKRHDYHVKLGRHSKKVDDQMIYPDTCYWFMDIDQLKASFVYDEEVTPEILDECLDNAKKVALECEITFDTKMHAPEYPVPEESTEDAELSRICFEALNKIIEYKPNPQEYIDRLNRELGVIKQKKFSGYFLVVNDYVKWAKNHDIAVGPGRGSAAGSLVLYLLDISQADPIKYGLMFERFLDPKREAYPDVDMDFEVGRRDELFRYVSEKYGEDHCALVSTLHMRKAKSAIRDAARILGYEPKNGNDIAKLIPEVCYGDDGSQMKDLDIKSSIESSKELKKMADSYPDIIETAESIEGIPSSTGIHAAGILISPVSLEDRIPLIKPNKEGVLATSLTLDDAERSFLKFDMLSLAHLDFLKALEKSTGWKFDYKDDKLYEDDAVWDLIGSRNTTGIFQIGSKTYKDRMPRLKPHNLKQLASCLALVRGPAISAKTDELYMEIVEGKKEIQKIHPLYDKITKDTNGIMIYQEQTMRLAVAFGMDLTTGYRIVKSGANFLPA